MPVHYLAWRRTMKRHGIRFDEDRFYALGGVPTVQIIEMLSSEQGIEIDVGMAAEEKERAYLEQIAEVRPVEPIVAIARDNHGKLPMGVGSGSSKPVMRKTLTHLGIIDLFDCLVGSEDTTKHKPEPDVFLRVAELLAIAPKDCLVYEDTDIGMEAAMRAGMKAFDVRAVHQPRRISE